MWRALLICGCLVAAPAVARGQCARSEPSLIGGLKCDDPAAGTWYQVEVYRRCAFKSGRLYTVLEVAERTPAGQTIRRRLPHPAVQGFVQDQILAGHRHPQLFVTKLRGGTTKPVQICGEQTRQTLDTVSCAIGSKTVEIDVDALCIKVLGQPNSALSFVERAGKKRKVRKVRKTFNQNDAKVLTLKNRGLKRARIWKGKSGKQVSLEVTALLRPDARGIDLVEVQITPKGGEPCKRIVEVARLWATKWPVVPRIGFVEAIGVASRNLKTIEEVVITIAPLKSPACQRTIDVRGIWNAYH